MKYDTIIIGAGSAGAILATRLSEDPTRSVLLLEAGPDYPDIENLPEEVKYGYASTVEVSTSDHNWQFRARATKDTEMNVARGRVTGGSSSINDTIFLRGMPQDYDDWARRGNDQWNFQKLLPYFNKIETDTTYLNDPDDFHGSDGPIICRRFPRNEWLSPSRAFEEACISAGFPVCEDANYPDSTGFGPAPLNNPDGIRWSTSIGYLSLARHRLNLTIRPNVSVKRIVFDTRRDPPRAVGVEAVSNGETFVVDGGEIVLSAGAIGSPQILMLSGVGPQDHLKKHNIPSVLDSPGVGQNLRDHPLLSVKWATKPEVKLDPLAPRDQVLLRYTAEGSSITNDMIVYFANLARERPKDKNGPAVPIGMVAWPQINLALGKGHLSLNSNDYRDQPYLDYNYLDEPEDRRRLRSAVHMLVAMESHPSLAALISKRLSPLDADLESDDTLDSWMLKDVSTGHHVSCTARMGPESDPMAVVDQYGRVHGVERLRVADASIMPDCIRANTNVTVMMIGERIADFIVQSI